MSIIFAFYLILYSLLIENDTFAHYFQKHQCFIMKHLIILTAVILLSNIAFSQDSFVKNEHVEEEPMNLIRNTSAKSSRKVPGDCVLMQIAGGDTPNVYS